ncbi:oligosaccharide flippase family protein [Flavobacterium gelidilacus]|jgi:O-antigen/teichoic acid export membrane protein|uniref:oligosaccharide flippase family protein n=1 Tax=Flavobacterium gelidilacus TaxID=206041 RepID=UPI000421AB87|nr:oligosaccharide flippase family protein [Flavobacterium gelidilacus]
MIKKLGLKNYASFGFGQIISLLTPIIIAPRLISVCGIENWGKIGVGISIFLILNIFLDFGNLITGIKTISTNKNNPLKITQYLSAIYQFKFVVLSALLAFFIIIIIILNKEVFLYLFGTIYLVSLASNPIWYYQALEQFKKINTIIIISRLTQIILIYLLIINKNDYIYYFLIIGLSNLVVNIYFLRKIFLQNKINIISFSKTNIVEIFKSEFSIVLSNLSISLYVNIPILIISSLLGNYQSGIYKIAEMIVGLFRSYLSVFFAVSFPRFCIQYKNDKKEGLNFIQLINKVNIAALFTLSALLLGVYLILPLELYFPSKTIEIIDFVIKFIPIPIIIALNIPFYQLLLYNSKEKEISYLSMITVVIMFVSCYFLTLIYQLNGSLISLYIVETFITGSIILYYYKYIKTTNQNI